ncbi:MAG: chaperone NapD [Gammaproteobacteria bacterium]|nr:chaperone NapD [Gammaproteobacteria bacterium]
MSINIESVHISSLVVYCLPEKLNSIIDFTSTIENVDVAMHDISGKLIVVLETETEQDILSVIDQIQAVKGVLTVTMVYHEQGC